MLGGFCGRDVDIPQASGDWIACPSTTTLTGFAGLSHGWRDGWTHRPASSDEERQLADSTGVHVVPLNLCTVGGVLIYSQDFKGGLPPP
jgi:hypothetical protein